MPHPPKQHTCTHMPHVHTHHTLHMHTPHIHAIHALTCTHTQTHHICTHTYQIPHAHTAYTIRHTCTHHVCTYHMHAHTDIPHMHIMLRAHICTHIHTLWHTCTHVHESHSRVRTCTQTCHKHVRTDTDGPGFSSRVTSSLWPMFEVASPTPGWEPHAVSGGSVGPGV